MAKSAKQAFLGTGPDISAPKIARMLQAMEPEDVCLALRMPWADIKAVLKAANCIPSRAWAGQCHRTKAVITAYTERGVYLKAQIKGWGAMGTDWDFIETPKAKAGPMTAMDKLRNIAADPHGEAAPVPRTARQIIEARIGQKLPPTASLPPDLKVAVKLLAVQLVRSRARRHG